MSVEFKDTTFIGWAIERDKVRERREAGLPQDQWTENWILKEFRFCNVSREDDRVTKWIKENMRDPYDSGPSDTLFRLLCLARFVNSPRTLGHLFDEGVIDRGTGVIAYDRIKPVMKKLMLSGDEPVFSPAYMVRSKQDTDKAAYVAEVVSEAKLPKARSREGFVKELQESYGFGTFMAGQVAADAAYTHLLEGAPDHLTWAPLGPGARRGMNMALGRFADEKLEQKEYNYVGQAQMERLPPGLVAGRKLTLHDVASNVNCETYKYIRISREGKGRRRFSVPSA